MPCARAREARGNAYAKEGTLPKALTSKTETTNPTATRSMIVRASRKAERAASRGWRLRMPRLSSST